MGQFGKVIWNDRIEQGLKRMDESSTDNIFFIGAERWEERSGQVVIERQKRQGRWREKGVIVDHNDASPVNDGKGINHLSRGSDFKSFLSIVFTFLFPCHCLKLDENFVSNRENLEKRTVIFRRSAFQRSKSFFGKALAHPFLVLIHFVNLLHHQIANKIFRGERSWFGEEIRANWEGRKEPDGF